MRRRQKVVAEATGFVICRRHGPAMPAPQARHEAHPLPSCLRFFPSDSLSLRASSKTLSWAGLDSNQRRRLPVVLQTTLHFGNHFQSLRALWQRK